MTTLMIGEELDLTHIKELAKAAVMKKFVASAEDDGVPPTLRALYVMKATEAKILVEGGESDFVTREAAARGVPAIALAQQILFYSKQSQDMEIERTKINVKIDSCVAPKQITDILTSLNIELKITS